MRHHTTTWILSVVILHSFISYAMLGAKPSKTIGRLNFCRALNQSDKTFNWWVHWLYHFLHNLSNLAHLYPRNNFSHTWGTEKKLLLSYLERLNELCGRDFACCIVTVSWQRQHSYYPGSQDPVWSVTNGKLAPGWSIDGCAMKVAGLTAGCVRYPWPMWV